MPINEKEGSNDDLITIIPIERFKPSVAKKVKDNMAVNRTNEFAAWCLKKIYETDPEALGEEERKCCANGAAINSTGTIYTSIYFKGDGDRVAAALQKTFNDIASEWHTNFDEQEVIISEPIMAVDPRLSAEASKDGKNFREFLVTVNGDIDSFMLKKNIQVRKPL